MKNYKIVITNDNTFTLKNLEYDECYHSSEGAVKESLYKHIYPSFDIVDKKEVNILDICFGLGYNTFLSVLNRDDKKLNIYSPELDKKLIKSLKDFNYPKGFEKISHIIEKISSEFYYEDENIKIEIFAGDARKYIQNFEYNFFDIVYQDAFSPKKNRELWTIEWFRQIKKILKNDGVITTYSVATPIRCALYKLGFKLYTHKSDEIRKGTIATLNQINYPKVDFEEKLKRVECSYLRANLND